METIIETTTLWDLLAEPSITLQLPRFALFLFISIILEIIYSKKKVCLMCSIPIVTLQFITGICGIIAIYYMVTSSFFEGDRVSTPIWYYPSTAIFIVGITLVFLKGTRALMKDRLFLNCMIRCLIFGFTVYFAISVIMTPYNINKVREKADQERQNNRVDPTRHNARF